MSHNPRSKYVCPTCGHPVLPKDPLAILSLTECSIFSMIYRAGQAGITRQALHERMYSGRRRGADSASVVSVHIVNINKKIKWLGLNIHSSRTREATYFVRRLSSDLANQLSSKWDTQPCAS